MSARLLVALAVACAGAGASSRAASPAAVGVDAAGARRSLAEASAADDLGDKTFLYNENVLPTCKSPTALAHPEDFGCVGSGKPSLCAGSTAALGTRWQIYGLTALYLDVDTTACGYADTPAYFAEVVGAPGGGHWKLTGTNAVYAATAKGFRVFVSHPHIHGSALWRLAMQYKWRVDWIGAVGRNTGMTPWGKSGWKRASSTMVFLTVDTIGAKFGKGGAVGAPSVAPRYFTSLHGERLHWKLSGSHVIYAASNDFFRVYVFHGGGVTPAQAEKMKWGFFWLGMEAGTGSASGTGGGELAASGTWPPAGQGWADAKVGDQSAIDLHVSTAADAFLATPAYITSLSTDDAAPLALTGAASVYAADKDGFKVYIDDARGAAFALKHNWRVNYVAFIQPTPCKLTAWGTWRRCSRTCGGGQRTRARRALSHGTALTAQLLRTDRRARCPPLMQHKPCATAICPTLEPTPAPTPAPSKAPTPAPIKCVMSAWGKWSACPVACGAGKQTRRRKMVSGVRLLPGGKRPCEKELDARACNTQQCIGRGAARVCGATTPATAAYAATAWKLFGTSGLYVDVSAAHCHFDAAASGEPQYVATVLGDVAHWSLSGTATIASSSAKGARIVVTHRAAAGSGVALLRAAKARSWRVGWVANVGANSGMTNAGAGGWRATKGGSLRLDVDTKACGFDFAPRYFTALRGRVGHYRATGSHVVYYPSKGGFSVYIVRAAGAVSDTAGAAAGGQGPGADGLTPFGAKDAEAAQWQIAWIGTRDRYSGTSGVDWKTPDLLDGGGAGAGVGGLSGLSMDVDTSASAFAVRPTYVAAVSTNFMHWRVSGAGAVVRPTKYSFSLYLTGAKYAHFAKMYKWRVSYLGYDGPVDCAMDPVPSDWSNCNATCNGGVQGRRHRATQLPWNGGAQCPPFREARRCNTLPCAKVDCTVGAFAPFGACPVTCGGGRRVSARHVLRQPAFGGRPCPALNRTKACSTVPCPTPAPTAAPTPKPTPMEPRNCLLYQWGSWGACSASCGGGSRTRSRRVRVQPNILGTKCPALLQHRACNDVSCIGSGPSKLCGATTPYGHTHWHTVGNWSALQGVYVDVDTSSCLFRAAPRYVPSLVGAHSIPFFGLLAGANTVSMATQTGFRFQLFHRLISPAHLAQLARRWHWRVGWIADHGANTGFTAPGHTGWKQEVKNSTSLYADVDTSGCGYTELPSFLASVGGERMHWRTRGAHATYAATPSGFRVALKYSGPILPAQAEAWKWHVSWIGVDSHAQYAHKLGTIQVATSGIGWELDDSGAGLHLDVLAKKAGSFTVEPTFVSSLSVPTARWDIGGAWAIGQVTRHGFRQYLGKLHPPPTAFAKQNRWRVAYVAYVDTRPQDCLLTQWATWNKCSRSCGAGSQQRVRNVKYPARFGGKSCATFTLVGVRDCEVKRCPVHCQLSPYGAWSSCSKTCVGGVKTRRRAIVRRPRFGGQACPKVLSEGAPCAQWECVGKGVPHPCGYRTQEKTAWKRFGTTGLYLDVDTRACQFGGRRIVYISSVTGEKAHWQLRGTASVAQAFGTIFRVIILHPSLGGGSLLRAAAAYKWRLSWIGDGGTNTGATAPGKTRWCAHHTGARTVGAWGGGGGGGKDGGSMTDTSVSEDTGAPPPCSEAATAAAAKRAGVQLVLAKAADRDAGHTDDSAAALKKAAAAKLAADRAAAAAKKPSHWLYVDVRTKLSHFDLTEYYPVTPRIFTTLFGNTNHWRTRGAHILHRPTRHGFRVFIEYDRMVTADLANRYLWTVQWVGTASPHSGITKSSDWHVAADGSAEHGAVVKLAGDSAGAGGGKSSLGMYQDVNARALGFAQLGVTPAYVSSVYTQSGEWMLTGAASLYSPTPNGFRIYLQYSNDVRRAKLEDTRVVYLGYQVRRRYSSSACNLARRPRPPTHSPHACCCHVLFRVRRPRRRDASTAP